jgi:hypothetical protein
VLDDRSRRVTGFGASVDRTVLDEARMADGAVAVVAEPKAKGRAGEVTLSLTPRVEFVLKTPAGWSAVLRDWVNPFRDFLVLAAWSPCAIDGVWLERQHEGRRQVVELLVRTTDLRRPQRKDRQPGEFAYTLRDCPGGFAAALQRFNEMLTSHKVTLPDIVSLLSAPYLTEEDRFMAMAKVVERLHVEQYGYTGVAKEAARVESDERFQRAVVAVPEDIRDWVSEQLKGTTPPMAKHRILEIFRSLGPLGDKLAAGHPDKFVLNVATTRNFVMHHRSRDERKSLFGQQRLWHTFALELAVQGCLVQHLGESDTTRLLERSPDPRARLESATARSRHNARPGRRFPSAGTFNCGPEAGSGLVGPATSRRTASGSDATTRRGCGPVTRRARPVMNWPGSTPTLIEQDRSPYRLCPPPWGEGCPGEPGCQVGLDRGHRSLAGGQGGAVVAEGGGQRRFVEGLPGDPGPVLQRPVPHAPGTDPAPPTRDAERASRSMLTDVELIARMPRLHSVVTHLNDYYGPPTPALATSGPALPTSGPPHSPAPVKHESWLRALLRKVVKVLR